MSSNLFGSKTAKRPHLVQSGGGLSGEIADLRHDVEESFNTLETGGGYFATEEFTDVAAADTDAIVTSFATAAAVTSKSGSGLNGVVGAAEMTPPRNITITSTTHADVDAVDAVITGKVRDKDGNLIDQTDTISITDGGGVTDAGTKAFSVVTSVSIPAMAGAGGALTVGFGSVIGLRRAIKTRAGLTRPIREVVAGAVATNGVFTTAAAKPPYGTYAPNTAPNGTNDYAITYEVDPAV